MKNKKILIVCPSFPFPESGAEQADRAEGIRQLVRLGFEVSIITKVVQWADLDFIQKTAEVLGVRVTTVPYRYSNRTLTFKERIEKVLGKFQNPLYFDGAAYEYTDPAMYEALRRELVEHTPDAVWFEYTYLWPLYAQVKKAGIPIVTRSLNFEPLHFLDESGYTILNLLKYIPKFLGERRAVRMSSVVLAITPKEKNIYSTWHTRTDVLPLRALPNFIYLPRLSIQSHKPLHVCFMGSSYKVEHNRVAAQQVITEIAPQVEREAPGEFIFHIFGGKLPEELVQLCDGTKIIYEGYVADLDAHLSKMDIALTPSLIGAGMQQKVFETLTRGIPTITSTRAIAKYPFTDGVEYVGAHTTEEFVSALMRLREPQVRQKLADAASVKTATVFSQEELDRVVLAALEELA